MDDKLPYEKGVSKVGDILSSKAQTMIDFKLGTPQEAYAVFDEAYTKDEAVLPIQNVCTIILKRFTTLTR